MTAATYTEDHLVQQPSIQLLQHELEWDLVFCYDDWSGGLSDLGPEGRRDGVLTEWLNAVLERLSPDLPQEAVGEAMEHLCRKKDRPLKYGVTNWQQETVGV